MLLLIFKRKVNCQVKLYRAPFCHGKVVWLGVKGGRSSKQLHKAFFGRAFRVEVQRIHKSYGIPGAGIQEGNLSLLDHIDWMALACFLARPSFGLFISLILPGLCSPL